MSNTLEVYLIRHAESVANTEQDIVTGRAEETPLSERGKEQARILGEYLQSQGVTFDRVYISPTRRTLDTCAIVCAHIGNPKNGMRVTKKLHENNQGDFTGRVKRDVYTKELVQEINNSKGRWRPPRGESQIDVERRMRTWLRRSIEPLYGKMESVGVFGHRMALLCLYRKLTEAFPPGDAWKWTFNNAAFMKLDYDGDWRVREFNHTAHLTPELRTNKSFFT